MKTTFSLNSGDITRYCKLVNKRQRAFHFRLLVGSMLWVFMIDSIGTKHSIIGACISMLIVAIVLKFFLVVITPYIMSQQVRTDPDVFKEQMIEVDSSLFHRTMIFSDIRIQWPGIKDIAQDKQCIYIFYSKSAAYVIPKRAFATPEQAEVFFHTITGYWKSSPTRTMNIADEINQEVWPPAPKF